MDGEQMDDARPADRTADAGEARSGRESKADLGSDRSMFSTLPAIAHALVAELRHGPSEGVDRLAGALDKLMKAMQHGAVREKTEALLAASDAYEAFLDRSREKKLGRAG